MFAPPTHATAPDSDRISPLVQLEREGVRLVHRSHIVSLPPSHLERALASCLHLRRCLYHSIAVSRPDRAAAVQLPSSSANSRLRLPVKQRPRPATACFSWAVSVALASGPGHRPSLLFAARCRLCVRVTSLAI